MTRTSTTGQITLPPGIAAYVLGLQVGAYTPGMLE